MSIRSASVNPVWATARRCPNREQFESVRVRESIGKRLEKMEELQ